MASACKEEHDDFHEPQLTLVYLNALEACAEDFYKLMDAIGAASGGWWELQGYGFSDLECKQMQVDLAAWKEARGE